MSRLGRDIATGVALVTTCVAVAFFIASKAGTLYS